MALQEVQTDYERRMQEAVDRFDHAFTDALGGFNNALVQLIASYNDEARGIAADVLQALGALGEGDTGDAAKDFRAELENPEIITAPELSREQVFDAVARATGAGDVVADVDAENRALLDETREALENERREKDALREELDVLRGRADTGANPSTDQPTGAPPETGSAPPPSPGEPPAVPGESELAQRARNLEIMCAQLEEDSAALRAQLESAKKTGDDEFLRRVVQQFDDESAGNLFEVFATLKHQLEKLGEDSPRVGELASIFTSRMNKFFSAFGLEWNTRYPIGKKLKIRSAHLGQYEYSGDDFKDDEVKIVTVSDLEWRVAGRIVRKAKVTEVKKS